MADKPKSDSKKRDAPAAGPDVQGDDEDPFAYTARRKTELSNDADHSSYSPGDVPNLVVQERGPRTGA